MKFALPLSFALLFVMSTTPAQIGFTRITCSSNIVLNLTQGDSCSFSSESKSENDKVVFEIYNNTLHIQGGNAKSSEANITFVELKSLNLGGTAKVKCSNLIKSKDLKLQLDGASKAVLKLEVVALNVILNGASEVELQGRCEQALIHLDGAAKLTSDEFIFNTCKVFADGASQGSLDSVTNDLKVEVNGASKIFIKCIPEVYVATRSGSGKIYEKSESFDSTVKTEKQIATNDDQIDTIKDHHKVYYQDGDAGFNWAGFNLGFNGLLNANNTLKAPANYGYLEMNNSSSFQIGLNLFEKDIKIYKRYVMAMIGAGFTWNNYKFSTPYVLQPYQPTLTALKDSQAIFSVNKLRVSYFNVPLLLGFNTSLNEDQAFHLSAGVVVGLRMGAMVKTSAENKDGKESNKTFALYNTDPIRYDFMVRLKYKWANIWASYSLNNLFRTNQGPEVHPVAVGVNLLQF